MAFLPHQFCPFLSLFCLGRGERGYVFAASLAHFPAVQGAWKPINGSAHPQEALYSPGILGQRTGPDMMGDHTPLGDIFYTIVPSPSRCNTTSPPNSISNLRAVIARATTLWN